MPKVTVNDISIHYEIKGQGKPLVLIMGLIRTATRDGRLEGLGVETQAS